MKNEARSGSPSVCCIHVHGCYIHVHVHVHVYVFEFGMCGSDSLLEGYKDQGRR